MKKSNQRIHKKAEQKKPMEKDAAHNNLQWTIKKRANIKKKKTKLMIKKKSTAQLRTSLAAENQTKMQLKARVVVDQLKVPGSCRRGL